MYSVNEAPKIIQFTISSELTLVDRAIKESMLFIKKNWDQKIENIKIVLREILINAVEHGNKNTIEKEIKFVLEYLDNGRFRVTSEDSGDGFDYKNIDLRVPDDPQQQRSRGLALINALSDEIVFNEKGSKITVYFSFVQGTKFTIYKEGNVQIIKPLGEITASCADEFRTILLDLLEKEHNLFRFDFDKVEDLDSISLSLMISFSKMFSKKFDVGELEIINVNEELANLFRLTRLDKIYNVSLKRG